MKCRIWYHPNGKVSVTHGELSQNAEVKLKLRFPNSDYEDTDTSKLPLDRSDRDRWRGTKATGIKVDNTVVLRQDIQKQLHDELSKPSPNAIKAIRLQLKLYERKHD